MTEAEGGLPGGMNENGGCRSASDTGRRRMGVRASGTAGGRRSCVGGTFTPSFRPPQSLPRTLVPGAAGARGQQLPHTPPGTALCFRHAGSGLAQTPWKRL